MIVKVYTTDGTIFEFNKELSYVEYGVDRMIATNRDNPDENIIIFSHMIVAIETREETDTESISWGTSD